MSAAEPLPATTMPGQFSGFRTPSGPDGGGADLDLSTPRSRARHVTRREVAWALTLSLLLTIGIVGTLLLQTAMQGEARVVQHERQRMASLQQQAQDIGRELARDADPSMLATRARALHMRPQNRPAFVRAGRQGPSSSR